MHFDAAINIELFIIYFIYYLFLGMIKISLICDTLIKLNEEKMKKK